MVYFARIMSHCRGSMPLIDRAAVRTIAIVGAGIVGTSWAAYRCLEDLLFALKDKCD